MEFILIATIAFMIIISGAVLLRNYAVESSDNLAQRKITEAANEILTKAKKMYFYGPPSKSVIKVDMPAQIEVFYTLSIMDNSEYYLVFNIITSKGVKKHYFKSDIPLFSIGNTCDIAEECSKGICKCFPDRAITEGVKNFEVKASTDCTQVASCILIEEISYKVT